MISTEHLYLDITAGSVDLTPDQNMVLNYAFVVSGRNQYLPVADISLSDPAGIFKKLVTTSDGLPVVLTIGPSREVAATYNMRLFLPNIHADSTGSNVRLVLYMDYPLFFGGTSTASITDSSQGALSVIANACGMKYQGDSSQDSMTWIPAGLKWCAFANLIASAGWNSNLSSFLIGVSHDGTLRYKNVGEYKYSPTIPQLVLGEMTTDGSFVPVLDWKVKSVSGFMNYKGAYHGTQQNQSVLSNNPTLDYQTTVQHSRNAPILSMNAEVKGLLVDGRKIEFSSIDCGNTHPNYNTAIYQNKRLIKANSTRLTTLNMGKTNIDLFDAVQVKARVPSLADGRPYHDTDTDGYYFVDSKVVYAGPNAIYCEKLSLIRAGHGQDPENAQRDL
jgi:hypothetical protein